MKEAIKMEISIETPSKNSKLEVERPSSNKSKPEQRRLNTTVERRR